MSTLLLIQDKNNYFFPYVRAENIDICECYLKNNLLYKILKRLPIISWFSFGKWKYSFDTYNYIILFDSIYCKQLGKYLSKKARNKSFLYSWNSSIYKGEKDILIEAKKYFKVYSFDKKDCQKYGLRYAPMVYSTDAINSEYLKIEYDIVFVGKDKGRVDYLYSLYKQFKMQNLKCYFYILGSPKPKYECEDFVFSSQYLSYKENITLLKKSKAVLDIQQEGQEGLTLRIVEALFYGKKIITSKSDIYKYDLYSPNNIFILNSDLVTNITNFLNQPMDIVPKQVLNNYDLKHWINNIVTEN